MDKRSDERQDEQGGHVTNGELSKGMRDETRAQRMARQARRAKRTRGATNDETRRHTRNGIPDKRAMDDKTSMARNERQAKNGA